jgi:transcriptional regulator with XRE-family HTH domain
MTSKSKCRSFDSRRSLRVAQEDKWLKGNGVGMRTEGWEEPMRELVEAGMAFRVVQEKAGKVQGWLRMVRHAVGIPVAEMARRMGVGGSEVYRMEYAEDRGVIELQTLRRAAEALGCDLVYGLSPREETLAAIAADTAEARVQKRADARERKLEKARERRREVARQKWNAQEKVRLEVEWQEYWRQCRMRRTEEARKLIPKPRPQVKLWKQELRKALVRVMRKKGMRVR